MPDTTKPNWWTPAAVATLRKLRNDGDYTHEETQWLAQLLEAAGCQYETELGVLKDANSSVGDRVSAVCSLLGGEYQDACDRIRQVAAEMGGGMGFNRLVDVGFTYVRTRETVDEPGYPNGMSWSNYFDDRVAAAYWADFTVVTGVPLPDDVHSAKELFYCHC